jgi:hypothetical protein
LSDKGQTPWHSTAHGLIVNEEKAEILLFRDDQQFHLPIVEMEGEKWENGAAKAQAKFQRQLSGNLNVLYRVDYTEDASQRRTESHFVLEMLEPIQVEGCWTGRDQLRDLDLKHKGQRPIIEEYLKNIESKQIPDSRPPWARIGWYKEASRWIEEQLEATGHRPVAIEPVKNWSLSYVLRARSENGIYYFKTSANLPLFVNEAGITVGLGQLFPDHFPVTIATDIDRDWLLMVDSGRLVGWGAPIEERKGFLAQWGQLQRRSAGYIDTLLRTGCLDRRLGWLESRIGGLINSAETERSLDKEEVSRLRNITPDLKALCGRLMTYNIPHTLVHGDLNGGNVAFNNGRYIFFDWTDACVSHPFFDMVDIYQDKEQSIREQLRDHYLLGWRAYEPYDRLRSAWEISQVLAALQQAISYHEIVTNIEAHGRQELDWGLPFWLRKVLGYFELVRRENG